MKKTIIILSLIFLPGICLAQSGISSRLAGYILLAVEQNGEAWYVNPADAKRYYLGRPADAFAVMRELGVGITDADLLRIEVGLIGTDEEDNDLDSLPDSLEKALGSDPWVPDTDGDGYTDEVELKFGYDPVGSGELVVDKDFARKQSGKIFIQTEKNGEAWYVNPKDAKRYYLGRPADAFAVMRSLSLGANDEDLAHIPEGRVDQDIPDNNNDDNNNDDDNGGTCNACWSRQTPKLCLENAAKAIRQDNKEMALTFFSESLYGLIEYNMGFLNAEQKLTWSGMLLLTEITEQNADTVVFTGELYFPLDGEKHDIEYKLEKQEDGNWVITNL